MDRSGHWSLQCARCPTTVCRATAASFLTSRWSDSEGLPENMLAGQMPHGDILAHNDIVDKVHLGDRVNITTLLQLFLLSQSRSESCEVCWQNPHWYWPIIRKWMQRPAWRGDKEVWNRNFFREACECLKTFQTNKHLWEICFSLRSKQLRTERFQKGNHFSFSGNREGF